MQVESLACGGCVRHPAAILIDDVLNIYVTDVVPQHKRPKDPAARVLALSDYFTGMTLADINGNVCRAHVANRGSRSAARRELEDLPAAINHHRREGLCSDEIDEQVAARYEIDAAERGHHLVHDLWVERAGEYEQELGLVRDAVMRMEAIAAKAAE